MLMNRIPNTHYKADGSEKVKLSEDKARAHVAGRYDMAAYRCQTCGCWHTGRINPS